METENLGMRMFGIGRAIEAFDGPDSDGPDSDMEPGATFESRQS